MNRQTRRAQLAAAKKRLRLEQQCLVRGHVLEPRWVMRPAWVGAGVSIEKVHFDRRCKRCDGFDVVWADIEGEAGPQPEAMLLPAWLLANHATVTPPEGEIRLPNTDELAELAKKVGAEA